jgi:hypothetical protein
MWYRVLICVGGGLDIFNVCDICGSLELGSRRLCTQAAAEAYICKVSITQQEAF